MTTPTEVPVEPIETPTPRARVRRRLRSGVDARERRRKIWTYGLLVVSTVLMVNAVIGDKGYLANLQARRELHDVGESLRQLRADSERLAIEAARLRTDPQALEDAARQQLGLIKPGETIITIRDRPQTR